MINKYDGKIGTREFFSLFAMTIALQFSDGTPAVIFKEIKNATWMVSVLSGILIILPFIFTLLLLSKNKNKNMIEIIYSLTGNYIGFVFCCILLGVIFSAVLTNSRSYVDITRTMFFPKTPTNAIYFMLMAAAYLIAKGGTEGVSRTAWLFFIPLALFLILTFLIAIKDVRSVYLYPIFGPGIKEIVSSSITHISMYGEIVFFSVFFTSARDYKVYKRASIYGLIFCIIQLTSFYVLYTTIFDYIQLENMAFPFHELTMIVNIEQYFTNLGSLFFGIWIMVSIIRCAILLYLASAIFTYLLKLKDVKPLLLPITALVVILGTLPQKSLTTNISGKENILYQASWIITGLFPLLLWMISKIRGALSNES